MTADIRALFSGHGPEFGSREVGPGQQVVDLAVRVAIDDPGEDIGEIAEGLDAVQFAGFDQRGDDCPVFGAAIGACKEGVLPMDCRAGDRCVRERIITFTYVKDAEVVIS